MKSDFGIRLKSARLTVAPDFTVKQAATLCHTSPRQFARWEKGDDVPHVLAQIKALELLRDIRVATFVSALNEGTEQKEIEQRERESEYQQKLAGMLGSDSVACLQKNGEVMP